MKTIKSSVFLAVAATLAVGCGKHQKNPAKDLETLRAKALKERQKGPDKAQTIEKDIVVIKDKPVVQEQATISENSFVITAPSKVDFTEGQKSSFTIQPRSLVKGIAVELKAKNLPEGADLAQTDKVNNIYTVTWTPPYNTVRHGERYFETEVKFYIEITSVEDETLKNKVTGLVREKDVNLQVFVPQATPSDLKVEIPSELSEDTVTPFTVTAKVPGTNENSQKRPVLIISYDGVSRTAGSDLLELDGSRHIISESKAEYLTKEDVWKFTPIFDTKNIPVQPAISINGQAVKNAAASKVRLTFRVVSPHGPSSPEVLKQLKINLVRAPDAPKFDFSNLGQQTLQVTPGETTKFSFTVYTINQKATLALDLPSLKSIPGSPTIDCKSSVQVPSRKDCVLTWAVPCNATDFSLGNEIAMSATATAGNRTSEPTQQTLKTARSKKQSAPSCNPKPTQTPKTEQPKPEPKPVTPPPPSEEGAQ